MNKSIKQNLFFSVLLLDYPRQKITSRSQYFDFPQVIVYKLYYRPATRINT